MLADTAAIHAFGAAQARQAADLEAITSHLVGVGAALAPDALGPVGAQFLEALSAAVAREVRLVRTLGERVAAAAGTARVTAEAYVAAERGAGHAMSRLGV